MWRQKKLFQSSGLGHRRVNRVIKLMTPRSSLFSFSLSLSVWSHFLPSQSLSHTVFLPGKTRAIMKIVKICKSVLDGITSSVWRLAPCSPMVCRGNVACYKFTTCELKLSVKKIELSLESRLDIEKKVYILNVRKSEVHLKIPSWIMRNERIYI